MDLHIKLRCPVCRQSVSDFAFCKGSTCPKCGTYIRNNMNEECSSADKVNLLASALVEEFNNSFDQNNPHRVYRVPLGHFRIDEQEKTRIRSTVEERLLANPMVAEVESVSFNESSALLKVSPKPPTKRSIATSDVDSDKRKSSKRKASESKRDDRRNKIVAELNSRIVFEKRNHSEGDSFTFSVPLDNGDVPIYSIEYDLANRLKNSGIRNVTLTNSGSLAKVFVELYSGEEINTSQSHSLKCGIKCPTCGNSWEVYSFVSEEKCPKCGHYATNNKLYRGKDEEEAVQILLNAFEDELENRRKSFYKDQCIIINLSFGAIYLTNGRTVLEEKIRDMLDNDSRYDGYEINISSSSLYSRVFPSMRESKRLSAQWERRHRTAGDYVGFTIESIEFLVMAFRAIIILVLFVLFLFLVGKCSNL